MNASPERQPELNRSVDQYRPVRIFRRGARVHPLPPALKALDFRYRCDGGDFGIDEFIARNRVSALLIVKDGRIHLERYALGNAPDSKLHSFSVGKSFMSTLLGAAIHQGHIRSVEEPVAKYLPQVEGSGYETCSIRNLLQMSSGVKWEEGYRDGASSFARMFDASIGRQKGGIMEVMTSLPSEAPPGTRFLYNSGESHVLGELLTAATGKRIADYLSERIWSRFGMEFDGYWTLESEDGQETTWGGVNAALRDYGRFGLFILADGVIDGERILPTGWIAEASHPRPDSPQVAYGLPTPGNPLGYGYQWWSFPKAAGAAHTLHHEGAFTGQGIFGRFLYINPRERMVAAVWSEWPDPWIEPREYETYDFLSAAIEALRS
ncbi:MAG TPA: serine hydrolase [Verrucomicrobiae bacterium]|nr:serine hydrolase [Verrucomicrobiae bacterium]